MSSMDSFMDQEEEIVAVWIFNYDAFVINMLCQGLPLEYIPIAAQSAIQMENNSKDLVVRICW